METKICSFCGMEYPASEEKCPLCGHSEVLPDEETYITEPVVATPRRREPETRRPRRRTGARVAPSSSPIPKWLVALTCIILALAVVIFVLFLLSRAGVFDSKPAQDGSVQLPIGDEGGKDDQDTPDDTTTPVEPGTPSTDEQPVDPVLCTGLTLNRDEITPQSVGDIIQLSAIPTPANTTDEIIWSSSNPMVCSVSSDGTVMVNAPGNDVIISASCGAMTATCIIRVSNIGGEPEQSDANANHSISASDITLFTKGESTTLRLTNTKDGDEIVWESEDPEIASVNSNGYVKAEGRGTTNVTATLNGKTYTCIVRCNFTNSDGAESGSTSGTVTRADGAEYGGYTISHEDVTLHYLENESFRLTLGGYEGTIVWTSSDTSVCKTNGSIVTAVGAGTAKVYALVGSTTYTCVVRCVE